MMKTIFRLVLLLAIAAIGYWAWTIFFPNPVQVIRKQLNQIAQLASFAPGEGNVSRVIAIEKLGLLFSEHVEVTADVPGYYAGHSTSRGELMEAAAGANHVVSSLKIEFLDPNVEIGPDKTSASVDVTLKAKVGNDSDFIAQELKFTFMQTNSDWIVTRIETIKTLKP